MPARRAACTALLALLPLAAGAAALPPDVLAALQRARVPDEAVSLVVQDLARDTHAISLNARRPVNAASLVKLLTTIAALERLGPAWTWATPVWVTGPVKDGVLDGNLVIRGSGDPKLVVERLWLLLSRVQQQGVREVRGDIVLDSSAFQLPEKDPAEFDGDPTRPYNVRADALLLNFKSVLYTFVPDPAAGVARILAEPPLAGAQVDTSVPLVPGPCADWRGALKQSFGENGRVRFSGGYPAGCAEQIWPLADPRPETYNQRMVEGLWRAMGGRLGGRVRNGTAPADTKPSFEHRSPPLAEVVRDINKFSNNVMAEQLFLTLALQSGRQPATPEAAREALARWLGERLGELPEAPVLDNGSGLSRETRLSAQLLARLLRLTFDGPVMPELMASLPVTGLDGTLRRSRATPGRAHLKTGSLRDVSGVAGYVLADSGRRYVLVAIVNHPNAAAARPALDALVQWVMRDLPAR